MKKSAFIELTTMERLQAAVKIQRAWRDYLDYLYTCPYCDIYKCPGVYNKLDCPEEWPAWRLAKLDAWIDRFND